MNIKRNQVFCINRKINGRIFKAAERFSLRIICKALLSGIFITVLLAFFHGCQGKYEAEVIRAGVGVMDITPEEGFPHYRGISTGVKYPLSARAIFFEQADEKGAILVCDVLGIPGDLSRSVRKFASEQTGIPFSNISISATHTHTGPRFDFSKYKNAGYCEIIEDDSYISHLVSGMVEAIKKAKENAKPVEMIAGIGQAEGISFNRRFLMTDGHVRFNPGRLNPDIVRPVGPVDPEIHFLLFRSPGELNFEACLSVYALHTDTQGGTEYSPDYPHYLEGNLRNLFGNQIVSVFGMGTSGDINHIDVSRPAEATRSGHITKIIGETLAESIYAAVPAARHLKPDLKILSKTIYLPLQDFTEAEYQWALESGSDPIYADREWIEGRRRSKILSLAQLRKEEAVQPSVSGDPWRLPVEIHVFRLDSNTAIVTIPGEVLVELGMELKERSPFLNTFVIELANAGISYVPTLRAFREGDYEAINTRLAPGSGEDMIEAALNMLKELHYDFSR